MSDYTYVKIGIARVYRSNWKDELEDNERMVQVIKSRLRDMIMTTPRDVCIGEDKIDWLSWAGTEAESEFDSLIEYAVNTRILSEVESTLAIPGYEDDVEFPD